MSADNLRIIAAICSTFGSILLAWRVRGILAALAFVANMHESNIQEIASDRRDIVIATNSTKHVEKAKGMVLLVVGFLLLALSGALNFWALLI